MKSRVGSDVLHDTRGGSSALQRARGGSDILHDTRGGLKSTTKLDFAAYTGGSTMFSVQQEGAATYTAKQRGEGVTSSVEQGSRAMTDVQCLKWSQVVL